MKDDTLCNFAVKQEKRVDKVLENFVESKCDRKKQEIVKTCRQQTRYDLCDVHKARLDNRMLFPPVLSALNIPTYKLAKFLVAVLRPTTNQFTVEDSFHFVEKNR